MSSIHEKRNGRPNSGSSPPRVHFTEDLSAFRLDESNRPIHSDHVLTLAEAIEEKNLLADFPLLVAEDMTVLDGQHRLKAAELNDVGVYYMVAPRATIDDIAKTNKNTKKWTLKDALHRFVTLGHPDYLRLKAFLDRYPFFTIGVARDLCHYGDKSGLSDSFREGTYKCNDIEFAKMVAERLLDFRDAGIEFYDDRIFIVSVANLSANADYDHAQMMSKMEYLAGRLKRAVDMDDYFKQFNELYNYRSRQRVWLERLGSGDKRYRVDRKRGHDES